MQHVVQRGQRRHAELGILGVVDADDADIVRNPDLQIGKRVDAGGGEDVLRENDAVEIGMVLHQLLRGPIDLLYGGAGFHGDRVPLRQKAGHAVLIPLLLEAVAGRVVVDDKGDAFAPLAREQLHAVANPVALVRDKAVHVGRLQIAVAEHDGRGRQEGLHGPVDDLGLVDRAHQHGGFHLALAQQLDVARLILFRGAGVVDQAGIALLGELLLDVIHAVGMVRRADIRDQDADHARGLIDQAARRLVGHIMILVEQLQNARAGRFFHMRVLVDHARNRAGGNAGQLGDVINGDFLQVVPSFPGLPVERFDYRI